MRSKILRGSVFLALFLTAALPVFAGATKLHMRVPMKPRLPLHSNEKILIAPFILMNDPGKKQDRRLQGFDAEKEFRSFLVKQLRKTKLKLVEAPSAEQLPTQSLADLGRSKEFWRKVGAESGAELIISGSVELQMKDVAGYRSEEYVSPVTGQKFSRQTYSENVGASVDIVIFAFDGKTGEKIFQDELRDARQTSSRRENELVGLYENLFKIRTQITDIFVPHSRDAVRYLLD